MRIRAETNPAADLSSYTTYAWAAPSAAENPTGAWGGAIPAAPPEGHGPSPAGASNWEAERINAQIQSAGDNELEKRGYVPVARAPELLISWQVFTRQKELQDTFGAYSRYRAEGGTEGMGDAWVSGYEEGSLVIEARDAKSGKLLWYGSATAVVNPELRDKRIPKAVQEIFARWPGVARTASAVEWFSSAEHS